MRVEKKAWAGKPQWFRFSGAGSPVSNQLMEALLALEDGTLFRGESFGAPPDACGEICFNTAMTGYQEVLTDPSYRGQIVVMTCPHVGNTGVNEVDMESQAVQVRGFVIEELSPAPRSWRATARLEDWLAAHGVPGIQGVDTRALAKRLRVRGAMRACLAPGSMAPEEAIARARQTAYEGVDFVREVTSPERRLWDSEGTQSGEWQPSGSNTGSFGPTPLPSRRVAAFDFGVKQNILRMLRRHGFEVQVVPATATADEVLALRPGGIFLSNGPGDPATLDFAKQTTASLLGRVPIFGICLGHQILAMALGGRTFKLKFGHRGVNHPVKDLRTNQVAITSQNHGYAVDPASLPPEAEVTHINLNDGTVAGLRHKIFPAFSVQYHPEASPGPHDAACLFAQFAKEVDAFAAHG